jgi:hypothetical protein
VTYEFINPSDGIVFDAPDDECAAIAAIVVGDGKCTAKRTDSGESVIGFAFLVGDGGFKEKYGRDLGDALEERAHDVVTACHSFRLIDGKRSSLSDWCGWAHGVQLRSAVEEDA